MPGEISVSRCAQSQTLRIVVCYAGLRMFAKLFAIRKLRMTLRTAFMLRPTGAQSHAFYVEQSHSFQQRMDM